MLKSEYGQTSEFNEIDTTSPDILIDILNVSFNLTDRPKATGKTWRRSLCLSLKAVHKIISSHHETILAIEKVLPEKVSSV